MKGISKLTAVIAKDRQLLRLFSGTVVCGVALLSIIVTAFVVYL
jgi:hypothetical protein